MVTFFFWFFIGSLMKGVLMFLLILVDDSNSITLLDSCLHFFFFGLTDWILLHQIKSIFRKVSWIRAIPITFGAFSMILFITGPIFSIYNWIFSIPSDGPVSVAISSIVYFLIYGFIISVISTLLWVKRNNSTSDT